MTTYLGKSMHTLDDKGRMILPKRILGAVAENDHKFILTAGPEGCLWLMDEPCWNVVREQAGGGVLADKSTRFMRRIFLGHAEKVQPDRSKRISIAEGLRQYAGLDASKDAVLVGTGQIFEIWAKARWESALTEALSTYEFSDRHNLVGSTAPSQP